MAETGILLDIGAFCFQLQNLESNVVWKVRKLKYSKNTDIVKLGIIRKKFVTMRLVRHWNRLHSEVVDAPSQEVFRAMLDKALSCLV